jgi:hypothetical protein
LGIENVDPRYLTPGGDDAASDVGESAASEGTLSSGAVA